MSDKKTNKAKRPVSWKRRVLITLVVVLSLILALLLAAVIGVNVVLNQFTRPDENTQPLSNEELNSILNQTEETDPDFSGPVMDESDVTIPESAADIAIQDGENIVNILLLGTDNSDSSQRSRSDAMILCTINKSAKTLTMTSFMRDTYLYIPGFYNQRMNVAYAVGGFEAIYDTLEYNFGVSVDKGVVVNFDSFREVIDAVGGVDVELTRSEANHLNGQNYTWGLKEGVNHLNGEQALAYSRIRKIDSDYARTDRQRTVLTALVQKAKSLSFTELYSLVGVLVPMVITDMSNSEILNAAIDLAPLLSDLEIVTQRIPTDDGHYMTMVNGMSVLLPDLEVNRQFLIETLGITEEAE